MYKKIPDKFRFNYLQRKRLFMSFSSIQTLVLKDTHIISVFVPTFQSSVAQAQHDQQPLYESHPSWGQIHWEIQESFSFPAFHRQKKNKKLSEFFFKEG